MKTGWWYMTVCMVCCLLAACGEDEYQYPSVKLEFVTVKSAEDGHLVSLLPDKGEELAIANDYTDSYINPNSTLRVLSNYETVSYNGEDAANIYSLQSLMILTPQQRNEMTDNILKSSDPVDVTSIWMGRDYLNLILNVKLKGDKPHGFVLLQEETASSDNETEILFTLFHYANGDEAYYNRNAYVSVPLTGITSNPQQTVRIKFKYYTTGENNETVESDKYCSPDFEGFIYTPTRN